MTGTAKFDQARAAVPPDGREREPAAIRERTFKWEDPLATAPAEGVMAARLPFGPFLCLAILEWMLAGPWIADRWLPWLGL